MKAAVEAQASGASAALDAAVKAKEDQLEAAMAAKDEAHAADLAVFVGAKDVEFTRKIKSMNDEMAAAIETQVAEAKVDLEIAVKATIDGRTTLSTKEDSVLGFFANAEVQVQGQQVAEPVVNLVEEALKATEEAHKIALQENEANHAKTLATKREAHAAELKAVKVASKVGIGALESAVKAKDDEMAAAIETQVAEAKVALEIAVKATIDGRTTLSTKEDSVLGFFASAEEQGQQVTEPVVNLVEEALKAKEEAHEAELEANHAKALATLRSAVQEKEAEWDAELEKVAMKMVMSSVCSQCRSPMGSPSCPASSPTPLSSSEAEAGAVYSPSPHALETGHVQSQYSPNIDKTKLTPDTPNSVSDFFASNVETPAALAPTPPPQTPPRAPPAPSNPPPPTTPISKFISILGKGAEHMRLIDMFKAMDMDHNQEIDKEELGQGLRRLAGRKIMLEDGDVDAVMAVLDKNGDGVISVKEWKDGLGHRIREHHRNKLKKKALSAARLKLGGKAHHDKAAYSIRIDMATKKLCDAIDKSPLKLRTIDVFNGCR
jgi:hypothetical protein